MSAVSTSKRLRRGALLLILLLVAVAVGEMLRRHFDREEELAIRRALVHARSTGGSPVDVEPNWLDLTESLRSRLRSDPMGTLARLAFGASARVTLDIPRSFSLSDRPRIPVIYGDRDPDEIPLPDRPYRWVAVVEGAWDRGPWQGLDRASWGSDGGTTGEIDLAASVPEDVSPTGWMSLKLRVKLKLYADDRALAMAAASSPEELAAVPFTHQEQRSLGGYRIQILDTPD